MKHKPEIFIVLIVTLFLFAIRCGTKVPFKATINNDSVIVEVKKPVKKAIARKPIIRSKATPHADNVTTKAVITNTPLITRVPELPLTFKNKCKRKPVISDCEAQIKKVELSLQNTIDSLKLENNRLNKDKCNWIEMKLGTPEIVYKTQPWAYATLIWSIVCIVWSIIWLVIFFRNDEKPFHK